MTGAEVLTAGKVLIWFFIPVALAVWELWRLHRSSREKGRGGDDAR